MFDCIEAEVNDAIELFAADEIVNSLSAVIYLSIHNSREALSKASDVEQEVHDSYAKFDKDPETLNKIRALVVQKMIEKLEASTRANF